MTTFAGVDGGGTRTTLVLADEGGRELARRVGGAGLVDPRDPAASAVLVAGLAREAMAEAGLAEPPVALCAGLAGVGNEPERRQVERLLAESGVASRVRVATDGEIALEGALGGGAGVLLIAGTGSVAYGRSEDGRVSRCGGWGMIVGDEGSGYAIGRAGLAAVLRSVDRRAPPTAMLDRFLALLGLDSPHGIPPWVGRAEKAEVAALSAHVVEAAEAGDALARDVLEREARGLAEHAVALAARLGPWTGEVGVVFHGGVLSSELYASLVRGLLEATQFPFRVRPPAADAVAGALSFARQLAGAGQAVGG